MLLAGVVVVSCALLAVQAMQEDRVSSVSAVASAPTGAAGGAVAPFSIAAVASAHNRLVVGITNERDTPLSGGIDIRVDGGEPHHVAVEALPLPGATAPITLGNVAVQRRAPVTIEVRGADGATRTFTAIVGPDQPNDLELAGARLDAGGLLTVTVANHSPIPLRGDLVVAARGGAAHDTLLARTETALDIAAGGTQEVPVGTVGAADLGSMRIALSTDAIADSDIGNDTYRP